MTRKQAQGKTTASETSEGGPRAISSAPRRQRVVALSGADSFLGRNLVGLLEEDPRVSRIVALDIRPPATAGSKTRYYDVDLTQPTSEERVGEILSAERAHTLVHVAFLTSPAYATAWAHELESVGTMHVLNAARQAHVRKLVHHSQTVLYGASPSNPNFLPETHPLRARSDTAFFRDKVEAESEALRFAQRPGVVVTVLRTAPILGPTVRNYVTRYLSHRLVPTLMGFDPLLQFLHEVDAVAAFKQAIDRDAPGVFNVVSDGVLPLTTVIRLAGRAALPIPHPIAIPAVGALWAAQLYETPPAFLDYLRYLCVADGERAAKVMGFRPAYSTREAVLDFATAQHLRDVRLLNEPAR
jgi:UDP-glucose 4-epimerase